MDKYDQTSALSVSWPTVLGDAVCVIISRYWICLACITIPINHTIKLELDVVGSSLLHFMNHQAATLLFHSLTMLPLLKSSSTNSNNDLSGWGCEAGAACEQVCDAAALELDQVCYEKCGTGSTDVSPLYSYSNNTAQCQYY